MSFINHPDSQNDVVTTIAPVIDEFLKSLKVEMPNTGFVYDPELSYETSVKNLRDDEFYNDDVNVQSPLFSFRRTILRGVEEQSSGKRLPYQKIVHRLNQFDDEPKIYASCMGTFNLEYVYYTKSILACEQFEVAHAAQRGVSGVRKINVFLGDELGTLTYELRHEPLDELTVNHPSNYYKALGGVIIIHGIYLLFESKGTIIKSINARVNNFISGVEDSTLLDNISINS